MMTEIQKIILTCLMGPEKQGAFKQEQKRLRDANRTEEERATKREKAKLRMREVRAADPEGSYEYQRKYQTIHKEERQLRDRGYYLDSKERDLEEHRADARDRSARKRLRPGHRIMCSLRSRMNNLLRGFKSASTEKLLGCSSSQWRVYLESEFKPGMTWENYGSLWTIDHIRPCASFDLKDREQQKACFHWSNTQPLFALENLKKGDKYVG